MRPLRQTIADEMTAVLAREERGQAQRLRRSSRTLFQTRRASSMNTSFGMRNCFAALMLSRRKVESSRTSPGGMLSLSQKRTKVVRVEDARGEGADVSL